MTHTDSSKGFGSVREKLDDPQYSVRSTQKGKSKSDFWIKTTFKKYMGVPHDACWLYCFFFGGASSGGVGGNNSLKNM